MKKLLFYFVLFALFSCKKDEGLLYYSEIGIERDSKIDGLKKEIILDSFHAKNADAAYEKAYIDFYASKTVYEKEKINPYTDTKILHFKLLSSDKKDITNNIQQGFKDIIAMKYPIGNKIEKQVSAIKFDSTEFKSLKNNVRIEKDEYSNDGAMFYLPKNYPKFRNNNYLGVYFNGTSTKANNLHLIIQFTADDWLFFDRVKFKIDDNVYSYYPDTPERDTFNGGIGEWSDESVGFGDEIIQALLKAKSVKYKLEGSQYYKEFTLTKDKIDRIQKTLRLYQMMQ